MLFIKGIIIALILLGIFEILKRKITKPGVCKRLVKIILKIEC
jgi:hypothetical protein